jgi:hypothetical protein
VYNFERIRKNHGGIVYKAWIPYRSSPKKGWLDIDDIRDCRKRYHKLESVKRKRVIRNTLTKRNNQKKEEKQKKKGDYHSEGMGLNEDATHLTLNQGTRNNIRREVLRLLTANALVMPSRSTLYLVKRFYSKVRVRNILVIAIY